MHVQTIKKTYIKASTIAPTIDANTKLWKIVKNDWLRATGVLLEKKRAFLEQQKAVGSLKNAAAKINDFLETENSNHNKKGSS